MPVAVSVVICTWNRSGLLDQTLTRMRELHIPAGLEWELVVVNNNCTDDTDAVIASHEKVLPLRRLSQPTPGKVHAANLALENVMGELVVWTDDDVLVDADWLMGYVSAAERHPSATGFGGPIEPWFPVPPDPALMEAFPPLRIGFCGLDLGPDEREMTATEYAYGANMAYRLATVKDIRFDRTLGRFESFQGGHEDKNYQDRVRAAGGKVVWLPSVRVQHYVDPARMTLHYLKAFYYGVGVSDVRRDGAPVGPQLFGAPRYLFRVAASRYARFLVAKIRGNTQAALEHLRSYHYHRGLISGCRERSPMGSNAS